MSRNVEIISASAGTGKTTRLAKIVADAVASGEARPEAILATTFARRAAAELSERARGKLLQEGLVEQAQRLQAARIGTVNGVCGGLVQDLAFDFGLSPEIRVLDERQTPAVLAEARARVLSEAFTLEITEAVRRFRSRNPDTYRTIDFDWEGYVGEIVERARANDIQPVQLGEFAKRSWESLQPFLGIPGESAEQLDHAFAEALRAFLRDVDPTVDSTKDTARAIHRVRTLANRHVENTSWGDWLALTSLKVGAKSKEWVEPLREAAAAHDRHPRLHADLEHTIQLVFEAAAETLGAYQQHKERLGVIDYVDQEAYALRMLREPEVRERLAEEIDLVLVDEFQDTSPIQLAIFLELASIARRSVWVGDPKQAIYGFRGADPALMEAAVEGLLGGRLPEALATSWRSRPGLVHITSDLFAAAFAERGIDPSLVKVKPGREEDADAAEALGPLVERWVLASTNAANDASALAAGVAQLLAEELTVVDPESRKPRALDPGDVAILCPRHAQCEQLASELVALGIRAVVARAGLLQTLEGRLALAALRLFQDPRDDLARAELARWLEYPEDGDAWLARLLDARAAKDAPFAELPTVRALEEARAEHPLASALPAFDAALAALDLREWCARFGDADRRLANLDALRSLAGAYVDLRRAEGDPATLHGLLLHLAELARAEEDAQAAPRRPDSVVVGTWHGAKGLEWPVTVLADLGSPREPSAFGLHLAHEGGAIDLEDPLGGRWIRFWPDPYFPRRKGAPLFDRLEQAAELQEATERDRDEQLRLLYVGWTRARDRLVLAARKGQLGNARFGKLAAKGDPLLSEPDEEGWAAWPAHPEGDDGREPGIALNIRVLEPADGAAAPPSPGKAHTPRGPQAHPAAFMSPSSIEEAGKSASGALPEPQTIGERMQLSLPEGASMADLGDALHGFLAADRHTESDDARRELAEGCLARFGVSAALQPSEMVRASDALRAWIDQHHPDAHWRREWPIQHRLEAGTILRGQVDLVLETPRGLVVIDHKSFPGSRGDALERAKSYAPQLAAYASALAAAGDAPILGAFVNLPVLGWMVEVGIETD